MWQILFICIFTLVLIRFIMAKSKAFNFNFLEYHHLDTGWIMVWVSIYLIHIGSFIWATLLYLIGLFLAIDDTIQHMHQVENPSYHSFGHKIGRPIYHLINWLAKNVSWLKWLRRL